MCEWESARDCSMFASMLERILRSCTKNLADLFTLPLDDDGRASLVGFRLGPWRFWAAVR